MDKSYQSYYIIPNAMKLRIGDFKMGQPYFSKN